jgi:hypothetical protein
MKAQEKAEELVLKYLRIENNTLEWFNKHIAKQCAIIAVDEIIELLLDLSKGYYTFSFNVKYYAEVKEEINKL